MLINASIPYVVDEQMITCHFY